MYNLVQFLGFSWIFVNLTVRLFILGQGLFVCLFVCWSVNVNTCGTTNAAQANPALRMWLRMRDELLFVSWKYVQQGFVLQMTDVECDAVCCLIIPVGVALCRFLLRYLPHHSRHDVFLSDDGRARSCESTLGSGQDWIFPCYDTSNCTWLFNITIIK